MKSRFADSQEFRRFLAAEGWQTEHIARQMGAANRHEVFLLEDADRRAVLKIHEPAATGRRDAFAHEALLHAFYAEQVGEWVPRLIAQDKDSRALLFEHVEGTPMAGEGSSLADVARMAKFILETNRPDVLERARQAKLPAASDSGLSPAEHWQCALSRVEALLALPAADEATVAMQNFVRAELQAALAKSKPDASRPAEPCLSPSDFGFHNVIRRGNGAFCFLDFEHAGWDDPAKLVADFILQPEAPLSAEAAEVLIDALSGGTILGPQLASNVRRILPLQKCKWTAIILNVFGRAAASAEIKSGRLAKAVAYWRSVSLLQPQM
jgi:hypothetical protein